MGATIKNIIRYFFSIYKKEKNSVITFEKETGNGFVDQLRLRYNQNSSKRLFGKEIKVTDTFWHLHSLNELFVDQVYNFKSENDAPLIVDCGANVGLSVIFFKRIFPNAKIVAYEADPSIFQMMQKNLSTFNLDDCIIENKAVWIDNTTVTFDATGALGGSLVGSDINVTSTVISVKAIRLKDVLKDLIKQDSKIDFLKIDIEGAEFKILLDCEPELKSIQNIFVEFHREKDGNERIGEYLTILERAGFSLYIKEAWNNMPKPLLYNEYNPKFDLQINVFGYRK